MWISLRLIRLGEEKKLFREVGIQRITTKE